MTATSFATVLTDSGRAISTHPFENNDCSVRAISNTTGLSYDEAWDELAGAGRMPLDGFFWEDWARKEGYINAPWTGKPHWVYRRVSLPAVKGHARIRARDIPKLFPKGAWVMTSTEHVEAWINGRHHDSETALRTLKRDRIVFQAWECRRIAADQRLFHAFRAYYLEGVPYMSALGPIPGTSEADAYRTAESWYGHHVQLKNSDLVIT